MFSSTFLWNMLMSYMPAWLEYQHTWDMTGMFIFLASSCREQWSFHSGLSVANALMPKLQMHGNCVSLLCGRIFTHNAPAWIWYPSPSCSVSQHLLFNRILPLAFTGYSSHLLKAQPPPLLLLYTAMSVRSLVCFFCEFSFGSASFFSPKATQQKQPLLLPSSSSLFSFTNPQFSLGNLFYPACNP